MSNLLLILSHISATCSNLYTRTISTKCQKHI